MLAFILPFKPKSQSKNWEKDCALLKASILSLLEQNSDEFFVYVVYSDHPQIQITSTRLQFIHFPFDFVSQDKIPEVEDIRVHFNHDMVMLERRWDKSRKIFYGCKQALQDGCDYLMAVDSDDLISNKLAEYVQNQIAEEAVPGFYIGKGYLYRPGNKRMIFINEGMQNFNGSTHILHKDLITIPDFVTGKWMDFNLFTSHGWIRHRLKESRGVDLQPIPFPAVIYMAHGGNISKIGERNLKKNIKDWVKRILRGKSINNELMREYNLSQNPFFTRSSA